MKIYEVHYTYSMRNCFGNYDFLYIPLSLGLFQSKESAIAAINENAVDMLLVWDGLTAIYHEGHEDGKKYVAYERDVNP